MTKSGTGDLPFTDISDPIFARSNYKKVLIEILEMIFSQIEHGLCIWYMNKNVFTNYKLLFDI